MNWNCSLQKNEQNTFSCLFIAFEKCEFVTGKERYESDMHFLFQCFFIVFCVSHQTVVSCFDAGGGSNLNGCEGWAVVPTPVDLTEFAAEPADEAD